MTLTLEELWVKAAVEHRIVHVSYKNPETRLVYNNRDVRPELITADPTGKATLWGLLNHNPFVGRKAFAPQFFQQAKITPQTFKPLTNDWEQLVPVYQELKLAEREP